MNLVERLGMIYSIVHVVVVVGAVAVVVAEAVVVVVVVVALTAAAGEYANAAGRIETGRNHLNLKQELRVC